MSIRRRLTRIQQIILIALAAIVVDWLVARLTGHAILRRGLAVLSFVGLILLLAVTAAIELARPLVRKLLWRVRTRLFVTYCLIGAVPVVLLLMFVNLAFYMVLGQTANYLVHAELDRRFEQIHSSAERLAQVVYAGGERTGVLESGEEAIVAAGTQTPATSLRFLSGAAR